KELARAYPEGSLVLAGTLESEHEADAVRGLDNVHLVPHLNRTDVVGVIVGADVCIIPHRVTQLTRSMSPLKLYEYLAGGRPVVAADLPPIRGVHPTVRLATTPPEYVDQVRRALAAGAIAENERRAFIDANAW